MVTVAPDPVLENDTGNLGDNAPQALIEGVFSGTGLGLLDGLQQTVEGPRQGTDLVVPADRQGLPGDHPVAHGLQHVRRLSQWLELPPQPPPHQATGQPGQGAGYGQQTPLQSV